MTEFVSVDGLLNAQSQEKLTKYLLTYDDSERPLVAQIWGSNPEKFKPSAEYIKKLGFDGIDINMGCPDKKVVAMGAGSALVQDMPRARAILKATKEGAGDLPVSVKIRTGYEKSVVEKWVGELLKENPAAITVHARTKKQMSKVPAQWEEVKLAVEIARGSGVPIIGNGDIRSKEEGERRAQETGANGIMVGRGVLGNPWFFSGRSPVEIPLEEKIKVMLEHARLFEKYFSGIRSFNMFRKHIANYINGFSGARELRGKLMQAKTAQELEEVVKRNKKRAIGL